MPKSRKTPLERYRSRMKRQGVVRVEIRVQKKDALLVRIIARELADPERESETRALLRRHFKEKGPLGLKALLSAAPLDGIELERRGDSGRVVEL